MNIEEVNILFKDLKGFNTKRMFGGYGLYIDDYIFGMLGPDDDLLFKIDNTIKDKYIAKECKQFIYKGHKNKKDVKMSYFSIPEELYDDKEMRYEWAKESANISRKLKKG